MKIDLLCIADTEGNFIRVNHQSEAVLGDALSELERLNFSSLIHEEDSESTIAVLSVLRKQCEVTR